MLGTAAVERTARAWEECMKLRRAVMVATALIGLVGGQCGPVGAAQKPILPKEKQAKFIHDAMSFGASEQTARKALSDRRLFRGLVVSAVPEQSQKVDLLAPTGTDTADATLQSLATTCGPAAASWSWRLRYNNALGQTLFFSGIRAIVWYSNLVKVSCPNTLNWADTTSLGAAVGWSDPTNTLSTGVWYLYGDVFSAAYHRIVENRFRFRPPPCYCVTVQTLYGHVDMWLHPDLTADASGYWHR